MTRRALKYPAIFLAILLIVFLSLDIHRLDSARIRPVSEVFDVEEYVSDLWVNHLPEILEGAVEINSLIRMLDDNPDETFENHSHKLGISNTHYFIVKAEGVVESVDEETVTVNIGDNIRAELETVYIFGNAVRDGSGLVDIDDFMNMMDFNMVSVHLNRRVKSEVVEPFRKKVEQGMVMSFTGATEINRMDMQLDPVKVIPVKTDLAYGAD